MPPEFADISGGMVLRGPILNPRRDGTVDWHSDGTLAGDRSGRIVFIGSWNDLALHLRPDTPIRTARGIVTPPFLDAHIHIPQWPVRGRFLEGVGPNPEGGPLLAGLNRNVFPAEARCGDGEVARTVIQQFLDDTLAKGVVGGAAYMTVHADAARIALEMLPNTWQVGLVLMNFNCPQYLRTDEATIERDVTELAERFGHRLIVTDRFAAAVDSSLRRRAVGWAKRFGLRMQTHLNEQIPEKSFVEKVLYPAAGTYTNVYREDGLLDCAPIVAHCVRMSEQEFGLIAESRGAAIAHCPTSNMLLGSGIMPLDLVKSMGIPYAICTDVGASPTTSILAEMHQFLKVHRGRSSAATAGEALFRATFAPAQILGLDHELGSFEIGKPMSFVEIEPANMTTVQRGLSADQAIESQLLGTTPGGTESADEDQVANALANLAGLGLMPGPELALLTESVHRAAAALEDKIISVTLAGREAWRRPER